MKKFSKYIVPVACIFLLASACKKNYLTDSGLHDPRTPLNNYDYLAAHPWGLFDTLLLIVDRFDGLEAQLNEAATFFAPTDYSIARTITLRLQQRQAINPLATYTLDSLIDQITADSVRQYLFNDRIVLDEAQELQSKPYTSIAGTSHGVMKELQTGTYQERSTAPTFLLYFAKVRGAVDVPGSIPPPNESDIRVVCQTSGILTNNGGTVLHVLSNTHSFVTF